MNFDTATIDECRDYIAEAMGWKRITGNLPVECPTWERRTVLPSGVHGVEESWCSPVPATIDAAAASLPGNDYWWCITRWIRSVGTPREFGAQVGRNGDSVMADGETEILARFRAACKAWAWVRENER